MASTAKQINGSYTEEESRVLSLVLHVKLTLESDRALHRHCAIESAQNRTSPGGAPGIWELRALKHAHRAAGALVESRSN
ncbi:uncharacterized [Tachysurus ichikawai]